MGRPADLVLRGGFSSKIKRKRTRGPHTLKNGREGLLLQVDHSIVQPGALPVAPVGDAAAENQLGGPR